MKYMFIKVVAVVAMLMALAGIGSAQVGAQSVDIQVKEGAIGVTYLNDGIKGMAGITLKAYNFTQDGKLGLYGLVVNDWQGGGSRSYVGALFGYQVYDKPGGLKVTLFGGWKGVDISDGFGGLGFASDKPLVFGVGVSFPVKW